MFPSTDSTLPGAAVIKAGPRNVLGVFSTYRLLIALLLLVMFNIELGGRLVGDQQPMLFLITLLGYGLGSITLLSLSLKLDLSNSSTLLFGAAVLDILVIGLMLQAGGSQSRPLSLLYIIAIFSAATVLSARMSLLVAALATLSVLSQAVNRVYYQQLPVGELIQAGVQGLVFFIAAIAVQQLVHKATHNEWLAIRRAESIRELQLLNEEIVQRMRTGIIVMNQAGNIHLLNESARTLLGLEAATGALPGQTIPPILLTAWRAWSDNPQHLPRPFQAHSSAAPVQASFTSLSSGDSCKCLVFLEDTRLINQQAQSLKLESLGRLTASIAHEIRNPLGAISHAAQLLGEAEPPLSQADRRFCEIITSQCLRVNQVIENVLTLSRRDKLKPRQIDLRSHLRHFIEQYGEHANGKPLITLDVGRETVAVNFDPSKLDQVLTNLFDNGLRYSRLHTGRSTLTVRAYQAPSTKLPQLDIIDQGVGIDEDKLPKIFEPFYTSEGGGTGLGLYLAREICEVHQTRLTYLKTQQRQSCFRLIFAHPRKRWLA